MQKKFYIIGHNPNSIEDAINYLKQGANGLEPDVCFIENTKEKFYVYEKLPDTAEEKQELFHRIIRGEIPSLKNYLHSLADVLKTNPRFRLSIISFDLVPPYSYNINELYEVIRQNFSNSFPRIAILTNASQPAALVFFSALEHQHINEAVCIDENMTPKAVKEYFSRYALNYGYGTGTDVPGLSSAADTFTDRARVAVSLRDMSTAFGLKIVHAWCVNNEQSMKTYLDIGVDAIVTNKPGSLKNLLESQLYNCKYVLADLNHDPFK